MKEIILQLNWLDIVFILLSLASIGWNIVQWVEKRKSILPLKSALIGLFNDIKAKSLHAYQTQNIIFAPQNPHKDITTLKWDYAAFTQTMFNNLQGFQEIVVSLLVSIDPSDREGKESFRAANYGLTPEDIELRRQYAKQQQFAIQHQEAALQQPSPDANPDSTKAKENQ